MRLRVLISSVGVFLTEVRLFVYRCLHLKEWVGYVEDRRPASNADPYRITFIIAESISHAEELEKTLHNMYSEVEVSDEVKDMIMTEPLEREVE